MKRTIKRVLSTLLILAMLAAFLPAGLATAMEDSAEAAVLTQADYAEADGLFEQISAMENGPAKKNSTQTELTPTVMWKAAWSATATPSPGKPMRASAVFTALGCAKSTARWKHLPSR